MVVLDPRRAGLVTMLIVAASGCGVRGFVGSNASGGGDGDASGDDTSGGGDDDDDGGSTHSSVDSADDDHDESDGEDTLDVRFDLGQPDAPAGCDLPDEFPSCDTVDDSPFHAMGFNCPGTNGPQLEEAEFNGFAGAMTVHTGQLGTYSEFGPREGAKFTVLSTGDASDLTLSKIELRNKYNVPGHPCNNATVNNLGCPSTVMMDMDGVAPDDIPLYVLPDPINVRPSQGDCTENVEYVGTGDCSNSLEDEWFKGGAGTGQAYDYSELRMTTTVPAGIDGFSYDFAFFSIEYPLFEEHDSLFNDMYVAWLDSESWTGNVSFDGEGHVISVKSVLFDYRAPTESCPACQAQELTGFAADGHGGTKWLTTTAPVHPGEAITLVLALFDMGDPTFDSMVILDHFEWTCSGSPPFTTPAG